MTLILHTCFSLLATSHQLLHVETTVTLGKVSLTSLGCWTWVFGHVTTVSEALVALVLAGFEAVDGSVASHQLGVTVLSLELATTPVTTSLLLRVEALISLSVTVSRSF